MISHTLAGPDCPTSPAKVKRVWAGAMQQKTPFLVSCCLPLGSTVDQPAGKSTHLYLIICWEYVVFNELADWRSALNPIILMSWWAVVEIN